jgi:hypothetical protein
VQWHFIGHLQSNKVKPLLEGVPNLALVETVDSAKVGLVPCVQGWRAPLQVTHQLLATPAAARPGCALPVVCCASCHHQRVMLPHACALLPPPHAPTPQLADKLQRVASGLGRPAPLAVLLQVNTSGEASKHGCEPGEVRRSVPSRDGHDGCVRVVQGHAQPSRTCTGATHRCWRHLTTPHRW